MAHGDLIPEYQELLTRGPDGLRTICTLLEAVFNDGMRGLNIIHRYPPLRAQSSRFVESVKLLHRRHSNGLAQKRHRAQQSASHRRLLNITNTKTNPAPNPAPTSTSTPTASTKPVESVMAPPSPVASPSWVVTTSLAL